MTESEAYELILLISSDLNQLMFGYFSVVSAFLVVSYLVAERLSILQSSIILVLYSICTAYIVLNTFALNTDLDSLYAEMLLKKAAGIYDLAWFGNNPLWVPTSLSVIQLSICSGGYVGSLLFFFSKGKPNMSNDFGSAT